MEQVHVPRRRLGRASGAAEPTRAIVARELDRRARLRHPGCIDLPLGHEAVEVAEPDLEQVELRVGRRQQRRRHRPVRRGVDRTARSDDCCVDRGVLPLPEVSLREHRYQLAHQHTLVEQGDRVSLAGRGKPDRPAIADPDHRDEQRRDVGPDERQANGSRLVLPMVGDRFRHAIADRGQRRRPRRRREPGRRTLEHFQLQPIVRLVIVGIDLQAIDRLDEIGARGAGVPALVALRIRLVAPDVGPDLQPEERARQLAIEIVGERVGAAMQVRPGPVALVGTQLPDPPGTAAPP